MPDINMFHHRINLTSTTLFETYLPLDKNKISIMTGDHGMMEIRAGGLSAPPVLNVTKVPAITAFLKLLTEK